MPYAMTSVSLQLKVVGPTDFLNFFILFIIILHV